MLKAYYVSGLPMDLIHAAATVIFILIAADPMLEKLDCIKVKYGLVEYKTDGKQFPSILYLVCSYNVKKELPAATCPQPKGKGLAHITQFF